METHPAAEGNIASTTNSSTVHEHRRASRPAGVWVIVEAHRAAWLESSIDSGPIEHRQYAAGESRRLMASNTIMLGTKDAGAFAVTVNGDRLGDMSATRVSFGRGPE